MIDAENAGLNRRTILRLHQKGELDRISRGVYQLTDFPDNPSPDYAALQKRVPNGVICLISALYHHNLTTEIDLSSTVFTESFRSDPRKQRQWEAFHLFDTNYRCYDFPADSREDEGIFQAIPVRP